jgi:hypothetical protein
MAGKRTFVVWTWRNVREFASKKEATKFFAELCEDYEARGWKLVGRKAEGYRAYAPDYDPETDWYLPGTSGRPFEPNPKLHYLGFRDADGFVPGGVVGRIDVRHLAGGARVS